MEKTMHIYIHNSPLMWLWMTCEFVTFWDHGTLSQLQRWHHDNWDWLTSDNWQHPRWLRDLHNSFHDGLGITFNDSVEGVLEVEEATRRLIDSLTITWSFTRFTPESVVVQNKFDIMNYIIMNHLKYHWRKHMYKGQRRSLNHCHTHTLYRHHQNHTNIDWIDRPWNMK